MFEKIVTNTLLGVMLLITIISFVGLVNRSSIESYTRLYPITDYKIQSDGVEVNYTDERGTFTHYFDRSRVFLHDGEDTLIIISCDENGKGFDGVKEYYLYLNENSVVEKIKERGGLL